LSRSSWGIADRYCFYDDGGNVILETDQSAAVGSKPLWPALTARQMRADSSSASNKSPRAYRSSIAAGRVPAWQTTLSAPNPRLLGGACGCTARSARLLAVWICATLQGIFAQ
jgi:hypothetical protein